jgi:Glycosyl transferase family 11
MNPAPDSDSVVIVRLIGGLGNQMFQYAAGRALAARSGAVLKLDASGFATYPKRHFELDAFPIHAVPAEEADLDAFGVCRDRNGRSWWARASRFLRRYRRGSPSAIYCERHFHFDAKVGELQPPVYLDGYWQSEKYFADCAELLRCELTPRAPLEAENADMAARIDAVNAVSLHVRRGDYIDDPRVSSYHGTCSAEYYRNATEHIAGRTTKNIHLFIFSDEPEWARDNLHFAQPTTIVAVNGPDRGFRDMQLMARCRHHVIANSSFSWWGAWLNSSPGKIVVAPRRWFQVDHDTSDLIPSSWVRM